MLISYFVCRSLIWLVLRTWEKSFYRYSQMYFSTSSDITTWYSIMFARSLQRKEVVWCVLCSLFRWILTWGPAERWKWWRSRRYPGPGPTRTSPHSGYEAKYRVIPYARLSYYWISGFTMVPADHLLLTSQYIVLAGLLLAGYESDQQWTENE